MSGPAQPVRNARSQLNARPLAGRALSFVRRASDIASAPRGDLKRVRLFQGFGKILEIFARLRPAELLDRRQLILGEIVLALDHIGFAEVLAHLRVGRVESDRLQVVADSFVRPSKLARRITAVVERARRIGVVERVEHVERFLVSLGLGERIGVFGEFGIGQNAGVFLQTLVPFRTPDLARSACGEVRRGEGAEGLRLAGSIEPPASAPTPRSSASASSTTRAAAGSTARAATGSTTRAAT